MDSDSPEQILFSETYALCQLTRREAEDVASEELPSHRAVDVCFDDERGETTVTIESSDPRRMKRIIKRFKKVFAPYIITPVNQTIEEVLVGWLVDEGLSIATAESVTGGMIAARLVDVPGVSASLSSSFVVYDDEAKIRLLGVPEATIDTHGAVSERVVSQMAEGLRRKTKADVCVTTSGYAGPTGEAVGTVCLGFYVRDRLWVKTVTFDGDRNQIRKKATAHAICELIAYTQREKDDDHES